MLTLLHGDALSMLKTLDDESVQTCVCSPPYWGLRDYGTATWEGGDAECDHVAGRGGHLAESVASTRGGAHKVAEAQSIPFKGDCGKCGARRVDIQIGLEKTPSEYVAKLVEIFREVRRVLRKDGTVFLNLGDSYFGSTQTGGTNSKEGSAKRRGRMFSHGAHAQWYGNGGKAGSSYQGNDLISQSPGDERTGSWWSHIADSDGRLVFAQFHESCRQIRACMEELHVRLAIEDSSLPPLTPRFFAATLDRVRLSLPAIEQLHAWLVSMPDVFAPQQPDYCLPLDMISTFLSSLQSFVACAHRYARMSGDSDGTRDRMDDSVLLSVELDSHIQCTYGCCLQSVSWLDYSKPQRPFGGNLKPKDLVGIPWMVAFALRADGWYLRSDIIWAKPNPMPESVTDRPTKSHEYIFLLAKNQKYFFDADAVRERFADDRMGNPGFYQSKMAGSALITLRNDTERIGKGWNLNGEHEGRNIRSVWTIATQPFSEAHFATFPPDLIKPCILAGTSARGCCAECGAPWERVTEKGEPQQQHWAPGTQEKIDKAQGRHGETSVFNTGFIAPSLTTGWQPTCKHEGDPVPCTVLDPFAGSGTTGKVAIELGRKAILIEPKAEYCEMIERRCRTTIGLPLMA